MTKINNIIATLFIILAGGLVFCCRLSSIESTTSIYSPIDVLYHGSNNSNIKVLEPRNIYFRDKNEGSVIFASPSIRVASCFLFKWDDSWVDLSVSLGSTNVYEVTMIILDKNRFKKEDKGGSIYILPVQGFSFDKNKGMGIHEWISRVSVKPLAQITFSSSLNAMLDMGVKVYFLEPEQFQHYRLLSNIEQEKFLLQFKK